MSSRAAFVLASVLALGCGHSEDEWQAQLAKYAALEKKDADIAAQLAAERENVKKLSEQLEAMGVKLCSEGSEKDKLAQDMAQLKAALAEYQARAETLERIKQRFETLRSKLQKLTELGLDVKIRNNRMVISLPGDVLFASGSDVLSGAGDKILLQVADVIQNDAALRDRQYQVAGHTDDQPLKRAAETFHDNWGLSLMRARQVLVFLVAPAEPDKAAAKKSPAPPAKVAAKGDKPEKADSKAPAAKEPPEPERQGGNLNPKRWSASGYGQTDPIVSNETPEGRKKNRRVELILMPDVEEMLDLKSLL
ncbi:MAG TPA: OmpA family protein [Polyangiaceae bacterium]|nr:OmpA family protein [Polyangiaceae bacterium]